jgi:hypothetical protein
MISSLRGVWGGAALVPGLLPQAGPPAHQAVQDTIAAVFRQRAYDRNITQTLWDRLWSFLGELLGDLLRAIGRSSTAGRIIEIVIVTLLVLILIRLVIQVASGEIALGGGGRLGAGNGTSADNWAEAQRLASQGHYTEAAHLLYAALLQSMAGRDEVRVHPSKTVGDYVRELRRRSSAFLPRFRDFARSYEVVVYGLGVCDAQRYERLYSLATVMVEPPAT